VIVVGTAAQPYDIAVHIRRPFRQFKSAAGAMILCFCCCRRFDLPSWSMFFSSPNLRCCQYVDRAGQAISGSVVVVALVASATVPVTFALSTELICSPSRTKRSLPISDRNACADRKEPNNTAGTRQLLACVKVIVWSFLLTAIVPSARPSAKPTGW